MKISKNTRNALFVFFIAVLAFMSFEPLFKHLGQNVAQEFASAIFGTIVAAVITMVLLSKQTETEQEKDRNDQVFVQKITLYNEIMDSLQNMFVKAFEQDGNVTRTDIARLEFMLAKMIMTGSDKTIREFKNLYETMINNYSPESGKITLSIADKQILFRFADYCREELGLSDKNLEKQILEDIVLQGALFGHMEKIDELDPATVKIAKDIYGYLAFDMNLPGRNVKFLPNGYEAYVSGRHEEKYLFLRCVVYSRHIHLFLKEQPEFRDFEIESVNGTPALVLRSSDHRKIETGFPKIEKIISESYNKAVQQV